jgi:hypothetical protein
VVICHAGRSFLIGRFAVCSSATHRHAHVTVRMAVCLDMCACVHDHT